MCRFTLYLGPPITLGSLLTEPSHSLIRQSFQSREREEPLTGDGFGVAFYVPGRRPGAGRLPLDLTRMEQSQPAEPRARDAEPDDPRARTGRDTRNRTRTPRTEIREHGTLRDLKRTDTASTVLDRDALRSVRETGTLPAPADGRRGFFRQWRAAVRARVAVLGREGLLYRSRDAAAEHTFEVEKGAERMVEGRMNHGERVPTTLRDLERIHGKDAGTSRAEPGRTYQGSVVGYAIEDDGKAYVVLDTGQELTAAGRSALGSPSAHPGTLSCRGG